MNEFMTALSGIVWGPVMIVLLVGTGLYLTIRLGFPQFRFLGHAFKCISGKYDDPGEAGDISHFKALSAALSATIGTGNIAGVATAIALGGPGAVFWMWMTALVGMATKFTSCSLALHFRVIHPDGSASGGPMYFLARGFHPRWLSALVGERGTTATARVLGGLFALFAMVASFGIGNMVQANSVVDGLKYIAPAEWLKSGFMLPLGGDGFFVANFSLLIGIILAAMVALVIIGGIRRIANVASRLVPGMSVIYVAAALVVLALNLQQIPAALASIVRHALTPFAATGGVAGATVAMALRFGVARGVFSNESGLGSAPMAHAAAKTSEMVREGFVAMLGPFIDTIVICTMTALVILVTGARDTGLNSASLTAGAFNAALPGYGHYVVGVGLILFAYSTMLSWSYYGDRCAEYLFGGRAIPVYRWAYVGLAVVGAVGGLKFIWNLADVLNALMAVPNLLGLLTLAGFVALKKRDYIARLKAGAFD